MQQSKATQHDSNFRNFDFIFDSFKSPKIPALVLTDTAIANV